MNRNLVAICFVMVAVGVVGAAWAASVSGSATARYFSECFPFGSTPECAQHLSTMSTYGAIGSIFQGIIVLGVVLIIVLVILEYVQTHPAAPPAPGYGPPPPAACPRCGRPVRWIPQYARWYCDSESIYV